MQPDDEERRRASAVIEAAEGISDLNEFLGATLSALDEHAGFHQSALVLALANGDSPGDRAYAGVRHGFPEFVLEEYFERWAESDPLISPRRIAGYRRDGYVDLADIAPSTTGARRRYVDDYLRRNRHTNHLSVRLAAGSTDGYLTVVGPDQYPARETLVLRMLIEPLTEAMRARLPRGIEGVLSIREAQAAELVSLGFTNLEIADVLRVEEDTVKKHVSHAAHKIGVARRAPLAVAWATGVRLDLSPLGGCARPGRARRAE